MARSLFFFLLNFLNDFDDVRKVLVIKGNFIFQEDACLCYGDDSDDGYVDNTHSETLKIVWEITFDVWAFGGKADAERRLQRNVTNPRNCEENI